MYSRFWHKVLFDLGHVSSFEPYARLFNQGYVLAAAYTDDRGMYVEARDVVTEPDGTFTYHGQPVDREWGKMGKSLKNAVSPEEIYDAYGSDTLRLHLMATGPLDASRPWETRDVVGMYRFLQRLWRNIVSETTGEVSVADAAPTAETNRLLHRTIDVVRTEVEGLRLNTAIAKLIELNNHLTKLAGSGPVPREAAEALVLMVAPFAPHIGEELWLRLGHDGGITYAPFPVADPALLVDDTVEYPVQVNGKVRGHVTVAADADQATVEAAALADERVVGAIAGATPKKVIVVPGRMVNVVV
jgi:leucyl-tRNA synthetase